MDEKFNRRFTSFCNSLDALSEAKNRDFSDSFVLSGTSAKFSITFGAVLCNNRFCYRFPKGSVARGIQSKFDF